MKNKIQVPILLEEGCEAPKYASEDAAGADIRAALRESVSLDPNCSLLVPTGLRVAIPEGYEIQVRPRSGLAAKHQVTVLNTPGTIDADYRGEIKVILINHGKEPFLINPGMRIAQLVLMPVLQAQFVLEESLMATKRGEGGFGHTGTH